MKETSTSQNKLLTTFDCEKVRMKMEFLQAQVPFPKASSDYKKNVFNFDANQIHPIDQIDMHRKSGEMLFLTMTNTAMALSKLKIALSDVQSQLNIEKMSSFAKDNRVKSLEDLVIKIAYDPTDVKAAEDIIKKKNTDIMQYALMWPTTTATIAAACPADCLSIERSHPALPSGGTYCQEGLLVGGPHAVGNC